MRRTKHTPTAPMPPVYAAVARQASVGPYSGIVWFRKLNDELELPESMSGVEYWEGEAMKLDLNDPGTCCCLMSSILDVNCVLFGTDRSRARCGSFSRRRAAAACQRRRGPERPALGDPWRSPFSA